MYRKITLKESHKINSYLSKSDFEKIVKWFVDGINKQLTGKVDTIKDVEVPQSKIKFNIAKIYGRKLNDGEFERAIKSNELMVDVTLDDVKLISTSNDEILVNLEYKSYSPDDNVFNADKNSNLKEVSKEVYNTLKALEQ